MLHEVKIGGMALCLVLCACASKQAGVVSTGAGTYRVSRSAANGFTRPGILTAAAEQDANQYCIKQHQVAVITSVHEPAPPFMFGNFPKSQVDFYCRDSAPSDR